MISFATRLSMTLRSFSLQAAWNLRGMQHLGFLHALRPALARIWGKDGAARMAAEQRQCTYFNTHPYFAPLLVGVAARLEEEHAAGSVSDAKHIRLLVNRMSGPFAAVGDAFFWETIRPCLAFAGVWIVLAALPADPRLAMLGPALFLLAFNGFTLPFRFWGVGAGYRHGVKIIERIQRLRLQETMRRLRLVALAGLGFFLGHFLVRADERPTLVDAGTPAAAWTVASAFLFAGLLLLIRGKASPTRLLYGLFLLGLGAAEALRWIS